MALDLTCVASFLVLLEERHYGPAARRLDVTSSALTKRIQRLERDLGLQLVSSECADGVRLTPAGRRFVGPARQLLNAAEAARQAVRTTRTEPRHEVVLGIPAGPHSFFRKLHFAEILEAFREAHPGTRVVCRPVPFASLNAALLGCEVDLLWTAAPVHHVGVESTPLPMRASRVGLVHRHHELAGAAAVDVETFAALPLLYNPDVPDEWMSLFYLGDVRPRREAQLVQVGPQTVGAVTRQPALRRQAAAVAPDIFSESLPPFLHHVTLAGAADLVFHVAHRRSETRAAVRTLVTLLVSAPAIRLGR